MTVILVILISAFLWLVVLLLPWQPWSTRECLNGEPDDCDEDLSDITVLIPARNEASVIQATLTAVMNQGKNITVILIDDQSEDQTATLVRTAFEDRVQIVAGQLLPKGWSGKLWALHQGLERVQTPHVLLLDADIELKPGILSALRRKMLKEQYDLVSLMAHLRMVSPWEKLLMPAFIYFFRLLYPFRLSNSPHSRVAAAAGGCILVKTEILRAVGGLAAIRGQLIDDCALARRVKGIGGRTWLGLTHSALSLRIYDGLGIIWRMVARTAFHQLRYSLCLLTVLSGIMLLMFGIPVLGLFSPSFSAALLAFCGILFMMLGYVPTLRFYCLSWKWAFFMPIIGMLFLAMTWTSAVRFWMGRGSQWKGRAYF